MAPQAVATKPAATKPAIKAKSNPWGSTDEEFPALDGASVRPHAHGWHMPKPQPEPTMTFVANRRPVIDSTADFPSLGRCTPDNSVIVMSQPFY